MSNQTHTSRPTAPPTIHIWMFATAVISTILAIPHTIVVFMLDMPAALVNLHIAITLGFWIGGIVFATHRPAESSADSSSLPEPAAQPLMPAQRAQLSELDELERRLRDTDR